MASVDFYRPAAVDQLEVLSKQVPGVTFYRAQSTDPVQAAKEIYGIIIKKGFLSFFS